MARQFYTVRRERGDKVDHDADERLSSSERKFFFLFLSDFSREEMADRYRGRDNAVRKNRRGQCRINRSDGNWEFISLIIFSASLACGFPL
jgi:hypothetical protein